MFGILVGLLGVLFVKLLLVYAIRREYVKKIKPSVNLSDYVSGKTLSICTVVAISLSSLPILILISIGAYIYKKICTVIIRRKDLNYIGLLDSSDVFWSLDDDCSKNIINVVGTIETESPLRLVSDLKDKLAAVAVAGNKCMDKIFFTRAEDYGFYYWRSCSSDIDEYVKIIENENEKNLEDLMAEYSAKPLPYHGQGLFQILVTANAVKGKGLHGHGIIFKIDHALGDGIALIKFLCRNLADDENCDTFKARNLFENNTKSSSLLIDGICKLIQIPISFAKGIIRQPDVNCLHGPPLTGNKIFVWTDDDDLLKIMKDIKREFAGLKFVELLTTALSSGLRGYLTQRMSKIPDDVSVILPLRYSSDSEDTLKLANNFSVTILDMPIRKSSNLDEIRKRYCKLRSSSDPITNYYFLKLVGAVLPNNVLKPMLTSRHATLVLSNLPGPEQLEICGDTLKELMFFVPNKGFTGLGVTALTYGGVLRLAASADTSLVSNSSDLRVILNGTTNEVRRLHRLHCSQ